MEVLPVLRLGRFHTSPYLVFYLLLFLGCYSLYLIELVLSFSKSPSLLKSEFGRKRYHHFRKPYFLSAATSAAPGCAPVCPAKWPARWKSRRAVRGDAGLCAGLFRTSILNVISAAAGLYAGLSGEMAGGAGNLAGKSVGVLGYVPGFAEPLY